VYRKFLVQDTSSLISFAILSLKWKQECASEMVIQKYQAIRYHNPRDNIMKMYCCKDTSFIYFTASLIFYTTKDGMGIMCGMYGIVKKYLKKR